MMQKDVLTRLLNCGTVVVTLHRIYSAIDLIYELKFVGVLQAVDAEDSFFCLHQPTITTSSTAAGAARNRHYSRVFPSNTIPCATHAMAWRIRVGERGGLRNGYSFEWRVCWCLATACRVRCPGTFHSGEYLTTAET